MAECSGDGSGDMKNQRDTGDLLSGTCITSQLLKTRSGEFDLESIFSLNLKQLDIDDLGSISACLCLQRLDVSRNDLRDLRPLVPLKQLVTLNIAANQITTLEPLKELESLQTLNAAGNLIGSFDGVYCLSTLQKLNNLRFQDLLQEWSNPICNSTTYKSTIMSHFPHLSVLDGERVSGRGSEVFTLLRQLDRTIAKSSEPASGHMTHKASSHWLEKGFWNMHASRQKELDDIDNAEKMLRDMLLDCRALDKAALHKIQQS